MSDGLSGPATSTSRGFRQWMPGGRPGSWLLGLVLLALVLLSLLGESGRLALRYEREAVLQGEYWRLLSGHLVHLSPLHLFLNVAGLGLVAGLFGGDYSWRAWLFIGLLSMAAIDAAFVFWEPQLPWYVGLSGVLHGALAAGGLAWWRQQAKLLALVLGAILVAKLSWEQWQGALPLSGDLPVVVDAHLFGAVGGVLAGLALWQVAHRQVAGKSRS